MLFAISGASRSGKTTCGRAVAEKLGLDFFPTSTAKVVERLGIDLKAPMTLKERLSLQMAILENHIEETMALSKPTIIDRTPIDMLAYLYAEFGMASHAELDEDATAMAVRYAEICREHVIQNVSGLFVLRPLPDGAYEEEAFKPSANPVYHAHYQMIVEGAVTALQGEVPYAIIKTADRNERVSCISVVIHGLMNTMASYTPDVVRH